MELESYFEPIEFESTTEGTLGAHVTIYASSCDIKDFDVALAFVPSTVEHSKNETARQFPSLLLEELDLLYPHGNHPKVLCLGVFKLGQSESDTASGIADMIHYLVEMKVTPIVIGGNREINYAAYRGFEKMERVVNLVAVDPYLNVDADRGHGYVGRIIKEQPNFLFNYANLGFQTYLINADELQLSEDLFFEAYRLGEVRGEVFGTEPVVRGADLFTCSAEAIRASDFECAMHPQPNGIFAEEVCQIWRYAGLTDRNRFASLTDIDWERIVASRKDLLLVAEMLWCYLDGYYNRKKEIPSGRKEGFLKYRVPLRDDEFQLIFYKSIATDRWWMEVPVPPQYANKYRKHHLIPCDYKDYQVATSDDLPERWWKAYKKML